MSRTAPTAATFAAFQARDYFGALDGFRAIAILLVLFHHVPHLSPGPGWTLQENGRYGVSIFFAISGFLICTLLLREERRNGRIALGKFYARRAVRLLPLYYAVLALQALLVFGLKQYTPENQELFREKLPAYLFYFSNWLATATQGPFFCSWSLAVEEQFYLGFGLLMVVARRGLTIALLAAALLLKFAVYQSLGNIDTASTAWRIVFSYQEAILWGVLLGFALNQPVIYTLVARIVRRGLVVVLSAFAVVTWLCLHDMHSQSTWDAEALYLVVTLLLAGLVVRPTTPFLGRPLMTHIGRVSYGIYLLHMFVISAVKKLPGGNDPLLCLVLSTALVVVLASVVHRLFERPIIRFYKRRLAPGDDKASRRPTSDVCAAPQTM